VKIAEVFDVGGRIAFVTGAASGLGLAYTEALAENGAGVTMADIDAEGLEREALRLRAAGCTVETAVVDVAHRERLRQAIDAAAKRGGRLDIVFANAGVSSGPGFRQAASGRIENVSPELWERILKINLTSVFVTMQAAAVHMKAQRSGRIVVTASIAGMRSEPNVGYPYTVTKAAVANLVRHAAVELAPYNVSVNAIAPGPFRTNLNPRLKDPAVAKLFVDLVPLGRMAEPAEIKGLALLLASPAASYLTGQVIAIDGGATALIGQAGPAR
jgi:NAD(P)-dependent dehydrogenase (short-subunit alcohol dehydrogenase family)